MSIRVQSQPFDPGTELNALHAANLGIGAVVMGFLRAPEKKNTLRTVCQD